MRIGRIGKSRLSTQKKVETDRTSPTARIQVGFFLSIEKSASDGIEESKLILFYSIRMFFSTVPIFFV